MMMNLDEKFWKKWEKADEIEQLKIIKELPMFDKIQCPMFSPTLINSYFVDLYRYKTISVEDKKTLIHLIDEEMARLPHSQVGDILRDNLNKIKERLECVV